MKHTVLTDDHRAALRAADDTGLSRRTGADPFWFRRGGTPRERLYWHPHVEALLRLGLVRVTASLEGQPVSIRATDDGRAVLRGGA